MPSSQEEDQGDQVAFLPQDPDKAADIFYAPRGNKTSFLCSNRTAFYTSTLQLCSYRTGECILLKQANNPLQVPHAEENNYRFRGSCANK